MNPPAFQLEKIQLTVGYMPLLDSSPLLWAAHRGYFREAGLSVRLVREVSWASLRDRLAYGAIDAAQCLAPMPVAASLGADGVGVPLVTGLCLSRGGSAITLSRSVARQAGLHVGMDPVESARAIASFVRFGGRLRLAHVFAFSMHHYLMREWLALGGISDGHPAIEFVVAPPPQMVRLLENGSVHGFCVGEPWNTAAVRGELGQIVAPTSAIWDGGADKVLGVTANWAQRYPQTHRALITALMRSLQDLSSGEYIDELAALMVRRRVLSVPESWIRASLQQTNAASPPRFARGLSSFPRQSQMLWCALQMLRWRQWNTPVPLRRICAEVCDGSAYVDVAQALGVPIPTADAVCEGAGRVPFGPDGSMVETRFLDGSLLDPENPAAYLAQRGWAEGAARDALEDYGESASG